jgi:hypothetical protein
MGCRAWPGRLCRLWGADTKYAEYSTTVHVYAIKVMVPWFDSIAYNAEMCSLPRSYGNKGMQPDVRLCSAHRCCMELVSYIER